MLLSSLECIHRLTCVILTLPSHVLVNKACSTMRIITVYVLSITHHHMRFIRHNNHFQCSSFFLLHQSPIPENYKHTHSQKVSTQNIMKTAEHVYKNQGSVISLAICFTIYDQCIWCSIHAYMSNISTVAYKMEHAKDKCVTCVLLRVGSLLCKGSLSTTGTLNAGNDLPSAPVRQMLSVAVAIID